MASKIFLTGASGYLGGEALYQISRLTRRIQLRCLIRDQHKAAVISEAYPKVVIVQGDLDDSSLIEKEACNADLVFHLASTRHEVSSRAIATGLAQQKRQRPGYWVQISGASMFSTDEIKAGKYGMKQGKVYDDVADQSEILDVVKSNPARVVDNLVLEQDLSKIRTALIPGPLIYGKGRGPINTRSIQVPEQAKYALENGHTFVVGAGEAAWSNVHVSDVGALMALLLEAALDGKEGIWNQDGIFFPENGILSFGEIAKQVSSAAVKANLIKDSDVKEVTADEANKIMPHGAVLLGTNAKLRSSRARRELHWKPSGPSLEEEISVTVQEESK